MPSAMELLRNYRGNAPKPLPPEERRGLGNFGQALNADLDRVDWQKRSYRVLSIEDKVLTVAEMLDTIGQFRPDLKKLAKRYPVLIPAIFAVACNTTPPTGGNLESKPPIVQPQYIEKTTPIVEIGPTPTPIPTDTPTPPPTDTPTPLPTYTPTVAPTDTPTVAPTETITPTETMQPPAQIKVVSKSLNVRPGPGTNYPEVLEVLKEGDTAKIVGKADNGWWEVVTVSGTTGWVSGDEQYTTASNADDVQVVETPPPPPTATPRPATATPESNTSIRTVTNTIGADVFVFDGIGGTRIGTFTNGAVAEVLEDNGPWLKVKLIDNTIGYIISIANSPIIETPQQVGVFDITGPPSGNKLAELAVNGGISGDPTIAFLDGGRFQESGVAYHALVVEGAGVTLEGSNYIVTLSSGNTITIPKLVSRIVVWVNGTQLGPGWMDVLATSRDVQPDYLQGPFAYDPTTGTLVLSY